MSRSLELRFAPLVVKRSAGPEKLGTNPAQQNQVQHSNHTVELSEDGIEKTERHLDVTEDDLLEAKDLAATYSLDDLRSVSFATIQEVP